MSKKHPILRKFSYATGEIPVDTQLQPDGRWLASVSYWCYRHVCIRSVNAAADTEEAATRGVLKLAGLTLQ